MNAIVNALLWAAAMILIAVGKTCDLVEPRTAETMIAIMPALAVVTSGRCACLFRRREMLR